MSKTKTSAEAAINSAPTDEASIREIIEKCKRETRIEYRYGDGFFKPRMRGINHLELGRSKIISSPITILIEWLYVEWKRVRNFFRDLDKRLVLTRLNVAITCCETKE